MTLPSSSSTERQRLRRDIARLRRRIDGRLRSSTALPLAALSAPGSRGGIKRVALAATGLGLAWLLARKQLSNGSMRSVWKFLKQHLEAEPDETPPPPPTPSQDA